jgi:predicted ATP-grasp superfamily ATP-dependent carboligase
LPAEGESILIAAQSGRALAAAARRAGLRPFVADLFGDSDTRCLAAGYRKVAGQFGAGIDRTALLGVLDELAREAGRPVWVVLGSGFEGCPEAIEAVASRYRVLGCSADAVRAVKDPMRLSVLLDRLRIPHPVIRTDPPADRENWVVKEAGASGGSHVQPAASRPLRAGAYLQRRVRGMPHGFAFLADGREASIIAVTRQWAAPSRRTPFRYGGAVVPVPVPEPIDRAVASAMQAIVGATGLRGLASADCLVDGDSWWLLEINPRPGATLDILDRQNVPLLHAHLEACFGHLRPVPRPVGAAASEVLYARRPISLAPDLDWPDHVKDRPTAGSRVAGGAPLCTITAEAADTDRALALLRARSRAARAAFRTGYFPHANALPSAERQRPCHPTG